MQIGRGIVSLIATAILWCGIQAGAAQALEQLPTVLDPAATAADDALAVIADSVLGDVKSETRNGAFCVGVKDVTAALNGSNLRTLPTAVAAAMRSQPYARLLAFAPECGEYRHLIGLVTPESFDSDLCRKFHCADRCKGDACRTIFRAEGPESKVHRHYLTKVLVFTADNRLGVIVFKATIADDRLKHVWRDPNEIWGGF